MIGPLTVSLTTLTWAALCDRRVWLDVHQPRPERKSFLPLQIYPVAPGSSAEEHVARHGPIQPRKVTVFDWPSAVQATREAMAAGAGAIQPAYVEYSLRSESLDRDILIRGHADWLIRYVPTLGSAPQSELYVPVTMKSTEDITEQDRRMLDLTAWLLGLLQGREVTHAEFWVRTQNSPLERVRHDVDPDTTLAALDALTAVALQVEDEPAVVLKPACDRCHWRDACRDRLKAVRPVELLPDLRKDARKALRQAGIGTWDELAAMSPDRLREFTGIKSTAEGVIATAQAFADGKPRWIDRLPPLLNDGGWMFDIEADPINRDFVWSLGWRSSVGHSGIIILDPDYFDRDMQLSDTLTVRAVEDTASLWLAFADAMGDSGIICHWTDFDRNILLRSAPASVKTKLGDRLVDLHHIVTRVVKFPIDSHSLKAVGQYLGYEWSVYDHAGLAWFDYQTWRKRDDVAALTRACSYLHDDVAALNVVWRWLVENEPR